MSQYKNIGIGMLGECIEKSVSTIYVDGKPYDLYDEMEERLIELEKLCHSMRNCMNCKHYPMNEYADCEQLDWNSFKKYGHKKCSRWENE